MNYCSKHDRYQMISEKHEVLLKEGVNPGFQWQTSATPKRNLRACGNLEEVGFKILVQLLRSWSDQDTGVALEH